MTAENTDFRSAGGFPIADRFNHADIKRYSFCRRRINGVYQLQIIRFYSRFGREDPISERKTEAEDYFILALFNAEAFIKKLGIFFSERFKICHRFPPEGLFYILYQTVSAYSRKTAQILALGRKKAWLENQYGNKKQITGLSLADS